MQLNSQDKPTADFGKKTHAAAAACKWQRTVFNLGKVVSDLQPGGVCVEGLGGHKVEQGRLVVGRLGVAELVEECGQVAVDHLLLPAAVEEVSNRQHVLDDALRVRVCAACVTCA